MKGVELIKIPTITDQRGNLSVSELNKDFPFEVKRIFWIYGIPENEERAAHAHRHQAQVLISLAGKFTITLDDGKSKETLIMENPSEGLLVPPGVWITLNNFSKGSVCLVLAPESYDEFEYLRDYNDFLEWKNSNNEFLIN